MIRLVEYHADAKAEIVASQKWYDEQSKNLGLEFLLDIKSSEQKVIENPERYPFHEGETRRILLDRFPFFLICLLTEDKIQVVALAHHSRRPNYWTDRLA